MVGVGARRARVAAKDPSGRFLDALLRWQKPTLTPARTGFQPSFRGCRGAEFRFPCKNGLKTVQFLETLILIGFALRYHSKRREGSGSTAAEQCSVRRGRSSGSGPQLLDSAVRARIIGAVALFVST